MANFARIEILITSVPTIGDTLRVKIDSQPEMYETPLAARSFSGSFTQGADTTSAAANLKTAIELDYQAPSGLLYSYPVLTTNPSAGLVIIEATEYGHSFSIVADPAWATLSVVPESTSPVAPGDPEPGYHRYKTTSNVVKTITLNVNGVPTASKTIGPLPSCIDDKIIKYLDSNGQFRFWVFNRFFSTNDAPELIGKANKFVVNIETDHSAQQNVGYRNERTVNLYSEATTEQLEKLTDLYTSPRIYLYAGSSNSDTPADWLEVTVTALNNIVRPSKGNLINFDIAATLPEYYTVTML